MSARTRSVDTPNDYVGTSRWKRVVTTQCATREGFTTNRPAEHHYYMSHDCRVTPDFFSLRGMPPSEVPNLFRRGVSVSMFFVHESLQTDRVQAKLPKMLGARHPPKPLFEPLRCFSVFCTPVVSSGTANNTPLHIVCNDLLRQAIATR